MSGSTRIVKMSPSLCVVLCGVLLFGLIQQSVAYVSVDDCTETGAHAYHSHSDHSHSERASSYSSGGYGSRSQHPSPGGYGASSSQYVRTGSSASIPVSSYSSYTAALNSGYKARVLGDSEDDLQVAQSVYSPSVSQYTAQEAASNYHSGGGGFYQPASSSYGASRQNSGSSYGSRSDREQSYDSNIRSKYEDLKQKADSFVHSDASPPVGGVPVPIGSNSYGSRYQHSQNSGVSNSGNVLGVTYGSTGVEEDESQRLIPVTASLPASGALVSQHKEKHKSRVSSYSTSGAGLQPDEEAINYSLTGNVPTAPLAIGGVSSYGTHSEGSSSTHESKDFDDLKQKAEVFVHHGGPPPTSHISSKSLQEESTHVETLPARSTNRGTIVVPVRVTVIREETVVPGGEILTGGQYGENDLQSSSSVVSSKKESYSSQTSSSNSGDIGNGVTGNYVGTGYSQNPIGSSSSYTYNSAISGGERAPTVYTVGSRGNVHFPEENSIGSESSSGYGSNNAYSKSSTVHRDNVLVAGAVPISNPEDYVQRSNKVFDMVSGYGTFLPAKEEQAHVKPIGPVLIPIGNQHSSVSDSQLMSSSYSTNSESSQSGTGYTGGYQGVSIPVGTIRKTTVYSSNTNSANVPTHISPGIPLGDPVTPPEVRGSYFNSNGKRYYQGSEYDANSNYNSGYEVNSNSGYGANTQSGYGVNAQSGFGTNSKYNSAVTSEIQSSGHGSRLDASRIHSSGYGGNSNTNSGLVNSASQVHSHSSYGSNKNFGTEGLVGIPDPNCQFCNEGALISSPVDGVKKYGISSSWSSKSHTVNGKTTESKQAQVTIDDNGKIDTYATHN